MVGGFLDVLTLRLVFFFFFVATELSTLNDGEIQLALSGGREGGRVTRL